MCSYKIWPNGKCVQDRIVVSANSRSPIAVLFLRVILFYLYRLYCLCSQINDDDDDDDDDYHWWCVLRWNRPTSSAI